MINLLLVEDNADFSALIKSELERANFNVLLAQNGEEALSLFENNRFDLVITDIMMPKMDGFKLVSLIREFNSDLPVLILTAKSSLDDKIRGFNVGTDDYMVKPIDVDELILRVNALLRRAKILNDRKLTIGGAVLDYDTYTVNIDGETSILPQKEFLILYKLLSYPDKIFTRNQLMEEFWGVNSDSDEMTIYTHIHRLRDRYQNCPYFEIVTIRSLGYKAVIK